MKRKTTIKQLMSLGASRNSAERYIHWMRIFTNLSNVEIVDFYKIYGSRWGYALGTLANDFYNSMKEASSCDGE